MSLAADLYHYCAKEFGSCSWILAWTLYFTVHCLRKLQKALNFFLEKKSKININKTILEMPSKLDRICCEENCYIFRLISFLGRVKLTLVNLINWTIDNFCAGVTGYCNPEVNG